MRQIHIFFKFSKAIRVCLIIYVFCKSCEHGFEPEIVQKNQNKKILNKVNKNNFRFTIMFATLTKHVNQHRCALETQKKIRFSRIYMIILGINLPAYTTIIY